MIKRIFKGRIISIGGRLVIIDGKYKRGLRYLNNKEISKRKMDRNLYKLNKSK